MSTSYPAALDTTAGLPTSSGVGADLGTFPHSGLHGNTNDAVRAIEAELGTAPSAAFATVKARLDDMSRLGGGCSVYRATLQSIPNTTNTLVGFPAEDYDTASFHDPAVNTGRITIPAGYAGKYIVTFAIDVDATAGGTFAAWIVKNGVVGTRYGVSAGAVTSTSDDTWAGSCVMSLAVADYIEIYVYQTTGVAMDILLNSANRARFTAALLSLT